MAIELTPEERRAMDATVEVLDALHDMGVKYNLDELTAAIHVLQGFVKQHVLNRLDPAYWSDWFGENDGAQAR